MPTPELPDTAADAVDQAPTGDTAPLSEIKDLLETVDTRQQAHERLLRFIAECVAPMGEDSSQINDLIGLLIGKIDGQSAMIRTIANQLHRQGKTLPGDVVDALDNRRAAEKRAAAHPNGANGANGKEGPAS